MSSHDYEEDMPIVGVLDQLELIFWISLGVVHIIGLLLLVS